MLRDRLADEASLRVLAAIESSAQHGADLVRQVLSFARGVEGRKVEVNVVHLLGDIKSMMRGYLPEGYRVPVHSRPTCGPSPETLRNCTRSS